MFGKAGQSTNWKLRKRRRARYQRTLGISTIPSMGVTRPSRGLGRTGPNETDDPATFAIIEIDVELDQYLE
jgi:hypothetical protein